MMISSSREGACDFSKKYKIVHETFKLNVGSILTIDYECKIIYRQAFSTIFDNVYYCQFHSS